MTAPENTSIRRILVALDGSPSSISALKNAAALAHDLDAELIGLFIEDINLFRAAQYPFAVEVSAFSEMLHRLDGPGLESQIRHQVRQMNRIMDEVAREFNVRTDFRASRGRVAERILAESEDADLLVLGKTGRSFPGFRKAGSTARALIVERSGMTLVWHIKASLALPVILIHDGSPGAEKAMEAATHLIRSGGGRLVVILVAPDRESGIRLREAVLEKIARRGLAADTRLAVNPGLPALTGLIRMESLGPVVIPCNGTQVSREQLCPLLEEIDNPVLLVRQSAAC